MKSSGNKLVQAKGIKFASLHRKLPWWLHAYVAPFALIYPFLAYAYFFHHSHYFPGEEYKILGIGGAFMLNVLAFLSCQWSNAINVLFTCSSCNDAKQASHVRVVAAEHRGKGALCPIIIKRAQKLSDDRKTIEFAETILFEFQKKRYFYDADKKIFRRADYPIHMSIGEYKEAKGVNEGDLNDMLDHFGLNIFDIPMPTFQGLFKEHAVAPFFVFQVFCVGLWFMDEYWYYSLFTLFMLFLFESTLVMQRLKSLGELRSMAQQPYDINVFRKGVWQMLKTDQLIPGDLVSVIRQKGEDISVPCDLLIIDGSCIVNEAMLSGESTPMIKESVQTRTDDSQILNIKSPDFKPCILFGGTKIIQHSPPESSASIVPPDGGCLAFVLRTGFGTVQGKLVRTMVFSTDRVTANNFEAFLFIFILLIFAIAASYYVWTVGIETGRKKSKLILECILIITSVVPPELPLELSMAVNQSLIALSRLAIFCLEPFRIPYAGKVDVLCFDKTGTLTSESLVLEGIAGVGTDAKKLHPAKKLPLMTTLTIASCHSLMRLDDNSVVGDPMEKTLLDSMGWTMPGKNVVAPTSDMKSNMTIVKKFPFSSALKRMSTIVAVNTPSNFIDHGVDRIDSGRSGKYLVAVKGAPEVLKTMMGQVPAEFDQTFKYYAMNGYRVLSLAYKWLNVKDQKSMETFDRKEIESDLVFCGFLVFNCPLKSDTAKAIDELHESMHRLIIITGDSPLTACHVAKELAIVRSDVLILDASDDEPAGITCRTIDESEEFHLTEDKINDSNDLFSKYHLCATGKAMDRLQGKPCFEQFLVTKIWVYARVSPSQKEYVLLSLKRYGFMTLMCGDGTNDVGALKQAHIGVALLDGTQEDLERIAKAMRERQMKEMKRKQEELYKQWGVKPPPDQTGETPANETAQQKAVRLQKQKMDKMMEQMGAMDDVPVLKFGDASVAAPFTSKIGSVQSICNIVRQGRCTLVTTIQMYKILALNSLISAFSLSALHLDGIRHSDTQVTIQGFLLSGCFLFLSWGKPIERLAKQRPQANIFNFYIITSIFGQFLVHIAALWYVVVQSKSWLPTDWKVDIDNMEDTKYEPNILSNAVYLISISMQVSTFMINYQGRPFRESLRENRPLYMSLSGLFLFSIFCASEVSKEFNETIELISFPMDLRNKLVTAILLDFGLAFAVEYVAKYLFANNVPSKALKLDDVKTWKPMRIAGFGKVPDPEKPIKMPKFKFNK